MQTKVYSFLVLGLGCLGLFWIMAQTPLVFANADLSSLSEVTAGETFPRETADPSLELISHIGGEIKSVFVQGNYAYVGEGAWLRIVDLTDPYHPVPLGATDILGESVGEIEVSGNYAYLSYIYTINITDTVKDVMIVDIHDVFAPTPVTTMNLVSQPLETFLQGSYLYILSSDGLHIYDLTIPTSPAGIGVFSGSGTYYSDMFVYGNYAFITNGFDEIVIVDISNPANPQLVTTYTKQWANFWGIVVQEEYAYVIDQSLTRILDISDPMAIVEVGNFETLGPCDGLAVKGIYVYCLGGGSFGVTVVDVSDPANPVEMGHYIHQRFSFSVFESDQFLYGAGAGQGLRILNVSNPNNPFEVATYDPPGGTLELGGYGMHSGADFREGYVYTADFWSGVSIIDVQHPAQPVLVNTYDTPGDVRDIEIVGDYAYLAETFQGLRILSLQNPEQPEEVALVPMEWAWEVDIVGNYAFVRNPDWIEIMVDVSDPANPVAVEVTPSATSADPTEGPYLYPYFTNRGVHQIDMSDPLHPIDNGVIEEPFYYGGDLAFESDTVYITEIPGSGFQMVDISDPAHPSILSVWDLGFSGWFSVKGNYLYVINEESVAVVDISTLNQPILLATWQDNGLLPYADTDDFQIIPVGNFIYAGIRANGLAVFYYDVSTTKVFIPAISR